jgi:RNA polymerase sigma-70 factor (ECF subfamily)
MTIETVDDRLIQRAQHGESAAFATIYDDLAPSVLRFLSHHVGDPDLAEELMQRTFVKMIEALPRYRTLRGVPFRAWVFRIARNLAIDAHRTSHPALDIDAVPDRPSLSPGPEQQAEASEGRDELLQAVDRLPPDQHDVIVYRFFADLAPREVAPLMHRSDGAVRILQHRALRRLRELLTHPATGRVDARPTPEGARP